MIIEFIEGNMVVKHSSGVNDTYTIGDIQKVKTGLQQTIIELKVKIATQDVYLKEMKGTKPSLLKRAAVKLHIVKRE